MSKRGATQKKVTQHAITLERAMVTRHYLMTWDLDRCVGCQLGPLVCPKDAVIHQPGEIADGRLIRRPSVDIDAEKCVLCGMCEVMCPKNAITLTINGQRENPVLSLAAFPDLVQSTTFDRQRFDWRKKDFVISNCPTNVISYDAARDTLVVDDARCIRCRQCVIASDGAFEVVQPWQGQVVLRREKCVPGCLACADICPTRALHISDEGNLVLAEASYSLKPAAFFQALLKASLFLRPTKGRISDSTVDPLLSSSPYLGTEIDASFRFRLFSDLGLALTAGVFLPGAAFPAASREPDFGGRFELSFSY